MEFMKWRLLQTFHFQVPHKSSIIFSCKKRLLMSRTSSIAISISFSFCEFNCLWNSLLQNWYWAIEMERKKRSEHCGPYLAIYQRQMRRERTNQSHSSPNCKNHYSCIDLSIRWALTFLEQRRAYFPTMTTRICVWKNFCCFIVSFLLNHFHFLPSNQLKADVIWFALITRLPAWSWFFFFLIFWRCRRWRWQFKLLYDHFASGSCR